ncbi:MAG: J domain-containing protein [Microcoleus vaginatus WJT46-NPBG5]|jgi:tetratricopeptide (TPR) repeat protein|nr:J domain-containing protein [Microcoleus vaginatus WJT46-NPBG5]
MNIADCYRLLGLTSKASQADVKASFRRLARLYHPDVNTSDRFAHEKFIRLHEAYKVLLEVAKPEPEVVRQPQTTPAAKKEPMVTVRRQPAATQVTPKEPKFQENCQLSDFERQMKENSYIQLQYLLKSQRFPRAIALVEGLAQRLPYDSEVRQWQAIAYQRWGRYLIGEKQLDKARIYLKKALRTDPHNRSLWSEVERDFRRLEKIF